MSKKDTLRNHVDTELRAILNLTIEENGILHSIPGEEEVIQEGTISVSELLQMRYPLRGEITNARGGYTLFNFSLPSRKEVRRLKDQYFLEHENMRYVRVSELEAADFPQLESAQWSNKYTLVEATRYPPEFRNAIKFSNARATLYKALIQGLDDTEEKLELKGNFENAFTAFKDQIKITIDGASLKVECYFKVASKNKELT